MSSINLEGLEMKEATPSIAPSVYESTYYTKKWRILIAFGVGACLITVCIIIFYVSARNRLLRLGLEDGDKSERIISQWRKSGGGVCLSNKGSDCPLDFGEKPVLLLALGGLNPKQFEMIPALVELSKCGVQAQSLVPSYPSYSYPNLYSIATGLYTESHGIVSNRIYDDDLQLNFTIDSPSSQNRVWWKGEPIWTTLSKQRKRTALYLWPGFANSTTHGPNTTYWQDEKFVFRARITKVVEDWIDKPADERPHLIMMYYEEPEATATLFGPLSEKVTAELNKINTGIDELVTALHTKDLINCVNLIVVSDHGVAPSPCENSIFLNEYLGENTGTKFFTGPVSTMSFSSDREKDNILRKLQCKYPNLRVLKKTQVPKRYHYTNNKRIGDLVLDTGVGYRIALENQGDCTDGSSGYNNLEDSMQGVFIAHGPAFQVGSTTNSFRNVEIYNLLCSIVSAEPSPNNGTISSLSHILKPIAGAADTKIPEQNVYLEEKIESRPQRPNDAILNSKTNQMCECDRSHWERTTEPTTSTTTTTESSTSQTSTTTTTTTSVTETSSTEPTTSSTSAKEMSITKHDTTTTELLKTESSSQSSSPTEKMTTTGTSTTRDQTTTAATPLVITTTDSTTSTSSPSTAETADDATSPNSTTSSTAAATTTSSSTTTTATTSTTTTEAVKMTESSTAEEPQIASVERRKRSVNKADESDTVRYDDEDTKVALQNLHCPLGCPWYSAPEVASDTVSILLQSSYIIGVPESLKMAIWVSFTLTKTNMEEIQKLKTTLPDGVQISPEDGCWVADPRLLRSATDQCAGISQSDYKAKNATMRQLFPEELEHPDRLATEGFFLSNMAPLLLGFENGGRRIVTEVLRRWTPRFRAVNVLHGPVFDYNLDGHKDDVTGVRNTIKPLIPSNYFYVVTVCNSTAEGENEVDILSKCSVHDLLVFSFVFPNLNSDDKCLMDDEAYLRYHLANLADVEELTGFRLFKTLTDTDHAALRIAQPLQIPKPT